MRSKLVWTITLLGLVLLATGTVLADVSRNHAHLRVVQLAADVEAASVTLQDGRTVMTNLTPGTVSDYMFYFVNRSTFITLGITPTGGVSFSREWAVPPLPPGYHTAALVGSSIDNTLDLIFIDENNTCGDDLESGSCVILINNIKGTPPLTFIAENSRISVSSEYRHADVNTIPAGSFSNYRAVDRDNNDLVVFEFQPGFFEPNVIYLYGLTGTYPGSMFLDYTVGITRRVPVDMMTFLRGFTADLNLNDGTTLFATENIVSILEESGLDARLSNPRQAYTVFAPIDLAVLEIAGEIYECALSNPLALQALILNHIITGTYTSSDLVQAGFVQTLAGTTLSFLPTEGGFFIDDKVRVDNAFEYPTLNGTVYLVDTVLVPEGFVEQYCGAG
jgi:hypothetical protein